MKKLLVKLLVALAVLWSTFAQAEGIDPEKCVKISQILGAVALLYHMQEPLYEVTAVIDAQEDIIPAARDWFKGYAVDIYAGDYGPAYQSPEARQRAINQVVNGFLVKCFRTND